MCSENLYSYQLPSGKIIASKSISGISRYILSNNVASGNVKVYQVNKSICSSVGTISFDQAMQCALRGKLLIVE